MAILLLLVLGFLTESRAIDSPIEFNPTLTSAYVEGDCTEHTADARDQPVLSGTPEQLSGGRVKLSLSDGARRWCSSNVGSGDAFFYVETASLGIFAASSLTIEYPGTPIRGGRLFFDDWTGRKKVKLRLQYKLHSHDAWSDYTGSGTTVVVTDCAGSSCTVNLSPALTATSVRFKLIQDNGLVMGCWASLRCQGFSATVTVSGTTQVGTFGWSNSIRNEVGALLNSAPEATDASADSSTCSSIMQLASVKSAFEQWIAPAGGRFIQDPAPAQGNVFETNAGTGGWGGACTCPDGQVYYVGDSGDACGSLACIGGTSGECYEWEGEWSGNRVTCTTPPNTESESITSGSAVYNVTAATKKLAMASEGILHKYIICVQRTAPSTAATQSCCVTKAHTWDSTMRTALGLPSTGSTPSTWDEAAAVAALSADNKARYYSAMASLQNF